MKKIKFDEVVEGNNPKNAFVAFHGWCGNKDSFKTIAPLLKIADCAWYFPEGPYIAENDKNKKSWAYKNRDGKWDVGLTRELLTDFFKNIILPKFKPENIFIIGFSQGAAVCYEFILSLNYHFGGIFPIAGFIRDKDKAIDIHESQFETPIIIGHGKDDDVVPLKASEIAYSVLKKNCRNVFLHVYNGKHKIGLDYMKKVRSYINNNDLSYFD